MTGILIALLIGVAMVVVACALILRSVRRRRRRMLRALGCSLPLEEFLRQASNYRCAFLLDFGFGRELWATFDDEPAFDRARSVLLNGKLIDGDGPIRDAIKRCEAAGITIQRMMMIDQQEVVRSGDRGSTG